MATLGKSIIHINEGSRIHQSSSLEFYSADTPMTNIKPAGGSTAIFVISASMVSASLGLIGMQSGSISPAFSGSHTGSIVPHSSSYIRIRSNEGQFNAFNLQIMSSSFTSTASLNSMPYQASRWHTASVGMEQSDSFLAHAIYNSFAFAHSSSAAARVRTHMTASSDYRKRLPAISASLDSGSNAIKIFVQRTGSVIIDFSEPLTSSFGFSIETLRTGSGQIEYPKLDLGFKMNPAFETSSFSMRLSDSTGKGFVLEADGHRGVSGSQIGSSNQSYPKTFFMSQSGQFGINTLNPHAEFEVSGTLSASVVDTPSITVAGRDVVTYTSARADNIAVFGSTGIVTTGTDSFKANLAGDITAVRQITASQGIKTDTDVQAITGSFHTLEGSGSSATKLEVQGEISASGTISGMQIYQGANAAYLVPANVSQSFWVTSSAENTLYRDIGNVAIGTDAAPKTLTVQGDISASGQIFGQFARSIQTITTNATASLETAGKYLRSGHHIIVIPPNASAAHAIGTEIEFFQTSSLGHMMITASNGDGVILNSRNLLFSASGQFSAVSCKKVGTDEWDVIGDLTT